MRTKKAIQLIKEALKQDHLYSDEELKFMKSQLSVLQSQKEPTKDYKGFGKK